MRVLAAGETTISSVAIAADGTVLAGTHDGRVLALVPYADTRTILDAPKPLASEPDSRAPIASLKVVSSDRVAVASRRGWRILDLEKPNPPEWSVPRPTCTALELLDDKTLMVGLGDRAREAPGGFELWTLAPDGRTIPRRPVFREPRGVLAVAVHRVSGLVAWSSGHKKITLWNPRSPDTVPVPLKHSSPAIAFHPDGNTLAAAQEWGAILIDLKTRHERARLTGHTGRVTSLAFSPEGRTLATASWDGTVKLWDGETGVAIASLVGPLGRVMALTYSPDGLQLAAAGDAGNVVLWDTE